MTEPPHPWDRLPTETAKSYIAFAAYLETGSLRDAYRQRSGNEKATNLPGYWSNWSTKYNWVSRRAAFVDWTILNCREAMHAGLIQDPAPVRG